MLPAFLSAVPRRIQQRQEAVWRAKRRIYVTGLLVVLLSTCFLMVVLLLGKGNFPSSWAYVATNLFILLACGGALLALRKLTNVWYVERFLTLGTALYLYAWDLLALLTHYHPSAEFLMTSAVEFLLAAALLCLVVPRSRLMASLMALFAIHEVLNWANLLQFPWSRLHNAQLMTDLLTFVIMLCLSLLGTYQHLIDLSQQETELMELVANTDPLTGLSNRSHMHALLQARPGRPVLLLDIDDFKQINDTRGHDAGDQVLLSVAQRIQDVVGEAGQVGRWGGEEFVVMLFGPEVSAAALVAEQIRAGIEQLPGPISPAVPVTVSIGVAPPLDTLTRTLKAADEAMYDAKHAGKNRVVCAAGLQPEQALANAEGLHSSVPTPTGER